jgi:phytoene synthase
METENGFSVVSQPAPKQAQTMPADPADLVADIAPHHIEHCRKRSLSEGSSLYYALLFTPEPQKTRLLGLATLVGDIQRIPGQVEDANIARIKLAWWKTEIEKTMAGQPNHPASHCLGTVAAQAVGVDGIARLVQAVSDGMNFPRYFTPSQWNDACADWGGEVYCMVARIVGCQDSFALAAVRTLGAESMRITQLLMLGKALGQGWHPFPVDTLQQARVSVEMLRQRQSSPAFNALVGDLLQRALTDGEAAWRSLPKTERLKLRALRSLWKMRAAEVRLASDDGYPLLTQRLKITPLRKLWMAWSAHALRA